VKAAWILREACGARFTGAVARVEHSGEAVWEEAFGNVDASPSSLPVEITTRFDLASLTKPFVTTAALRAVAEERLHLDRPLLDLVPEWKKHAHARITLRSLLAHTSGMDSGADYRRLLGEDVEAFALGLPLISPPFSRVVYSDLGFIALGVILSRAYGLGLGAILAHAVAEIGAPGTAYRPPARERPAIPATEEDAWRGRVRGTVHDEKAHLMNGIAGHAGLFGTAAGVAALAEAYLGPLHGRSQRCLPAALAREAIAESGSDAVLRRGLGWALKTSDENSCGAAMSRATFGHTGFVGTSVWADPTRDLSIVLLTNAVYFGRNDVRDLRAAVCDAVVAEMDRCARSA
jgi:CubicO group peptidase (beta-lactamase class C family)